MKLVIDVETNGFLQSLDTVHCIVCKDIETGKVYEFNPDNLEAGLQLIKKIVVATSNLKMDEIIYKICKKNRINIFRGHPNDLLSRYYNCAKKYKANTIVRITSDCPLMDYKIIDKIIKKFYSSNVDYISNTHPPVIPDGFDIEIFNFESLKKAFFKAKKNFQREHVTPYIWDNPKKFKIKNYDIFFKKITTKNID